MRSRPAPKPVTWEPKRNRIAYDPQVRTWVQRLTGDPDAKPTDLGEEQLLFVYSEVMKARGDEFDSSLYQQALADTCPVIAAPKLTDEAEDLAALLALEEMREFWGRWDGPRASSGPKPSYAGVKAHMTVMAMLGTSAHADDAHRQLTNKDWLVPLFNELEEACPTKNSWHPKVKRFGPPPPSFTAPAYSTSMRLMERLAPSCTQGAMLTNIALVKSLRELHPGAGVGERLLLDGTRLPAWCPQVGAGSDDRREASLRRHTPHAGFRAYIQNGAEKRDIEPGDQLGPATTRNLTKRWRGYHLVVIADQATGLPLVWTVFDASTDEAPALVSLLSTLHRLWPDINAKLIAGDSAWDEDWACRVCEVDYGIHPIFRLSRKETNHLLKPGESRDGSIHGYTHEGQLVCQHGKALDYHSVDVPGRAKLEGGQSADEGAFRLRGLCNCVARHPDSTPGLRMKSDWSKLTWFPHHPHGNPRRHAMRLAMLTRLNQAEGLFNRLKTGRKLGTEGPDRTRVRDKDTVEALISLAFLSFTGYAVADQRAQRDKQSPSPKRSKRRPAPDPEPTGRRRGHLTVLDGGAAREQRAHAERQRPTPTTDRNP